MKLLMSFLILLLCSCSRYGDQQIELSKEEEKMATPPCNCRISAQNLALSEDLVYGTK